MNIEQAQKEVDELITQRIWDEIHSLGIETEIHDVAMQGSYAKGTDLPTSGSDLDLFIIFENFVSQKMREFYGVEIGKKALYEYNPIVKDATSKYIESYFTYKGYDMEVQIVPTRYLTLDQIKNKELGGELISIGMERTPHQTEFMKNALKGKTGEVRQLKKFMKDNGLYDSSMKSQGFSGYATECLIHYLGSFSEVVKFFANFEKKSVLGEGKPNKDNMFSIIDPIDPNRDLISAFSPVKIARTILVFQHYRDFGEPPKQSKPVQLPSVTITYTTTEENEDTLAGQIRKTQNSIIGQLKKHGFIIPSQTTSNNKFTVNVLRISSDRKDDKISLTFGMENLLIPSSYKDKGVPLTMTDAIKNYKDANPNREFVEEDGRLKAIKGRKYRHLSTALDYLIFEIQQSGVTRDILNGYTLTDGKSGFENLI